MIDIKIIYVNDYALTVIYMKGYLVTGTIKENKTLKKFSKEFAAKDENDVKETVKSVFGSYYHLKRKFINIDEVKELKPEEITDHAVKYRVSGE